MVRDLLLYYHTIKYLRWSQIGARLRLWIRRGTIYRFSSLSDWQYERRIPIDVSEAKTPSLNGEWNQTPRPLPWGKEDEKLRQERAGEIQNNVFAFLNRGMRFEEGVDWDPAETTKLWRYNLHYFAYAVDLGMAYRISGGDDKYHKFRDLVLDWVAKNRIAKGVAWDPYPVSLRIVNWIYAHHLFRDKTRTDKEFASSFLKSLYKQVLFLEDNLEYHLLGNHLIENGKALLLAGLFFQGATAERWRDKGMAILWRMADEQILDDGGHFERSPMYHALVLQAYLESVAALRAKGIAVPDWLEDKLRHMLYFLEAILHPDGQIPLLNDSALGVAPEPHALLRIGSQLLEKGGQKRWGKGMDDSPHLLRAGATIVASSEPTVKESRIGFIGVEESGCYIMRDEIKSNFMVIDCGPMGPDHLPGHGHCDTLSYELSLGGRRFIVDSGVQEYYGQNEWRQYYRSTRGHNTVVVDGQEQSEIWDNFRVGRRAKPTLVKWMERDDLVYFQGTHDGYLRNKPQAIHQRRVLFVDNQFWIVLDEVLGQGEHLAESYIHFHPEVILQLEPGIGALPAITARHHKSLVQVLPFGHSALKIHRGEKEPIQGWYSPQFGVRLPSSVVCLRCEGKSPLRFGYLILPDAVKVVGLTWKAIDNRLSIKLPNQIYTLTCLDDSVRLERQ